MGVFPAQSLDDCRKKKVVQKFGPGAKKGTKGERKGQEGLIFLRKQWSSFCDFLKQGDRFGPTILLCA
jgi:hypothetical protein